jgi:hypothetical protein
MTPWEIPRSTWESPTQARFPAVCPESFPGKPKIPVHG